MSTVVMPHIRLDDTGVVWIDDTNVKVIEVVMDKLAHGSSPEEIHFQHPHLSLAQIHAALSYKPLREKAHGLIRGMNRVSFGVDNGSDFKYTCVYETSLQTQENFGISAQLPFCVDTSETSSGTG